MFFVIMIKGAYAFLVFMEELLLLDMLGIWFLPSSWFRQLTTELVSPFVVPLRILQKKSVIACRIDFSYLIVMLVLLFAKKFLENAMRV